MNARKPILPLLFLSVLTLCPAQIASAFQSRDHLTPQEVDLVKDTQVLDKRIEVFIKAAERRVQIITGATTATANTKQARKDSEAFGEMPTGTRAELMSDIAKIFDEAINNIDDVSARDEKNPLIPKALRKLAASVTQVVQQLKPYSAQGTGLEGSSFDQLAENADAILEAANKLPPEVAKKGKAKGDKSN